MLAYGVPADFLDEYVRMGESTIIECLQYFVRGVVDVFGEEYLTAPNVQDTWSLMAMNTARGFLGIGKHSESYSCLLPRAPTWSLPEILVMSL